MELPNRSITECSQPRVERVQFACAHRNNEGWQLTIVTEQGVYEVSFAFVVTNLWSGDITLQQSNQSMSTLKERRH